MKKYETTSDEGTYVMLIRLRLMILIALVGGGAMLFSPAPQKADAKDGYWNNYWSWYDNDYRSYYNRGYNRGYSRGYNPYYGNRTPYGYGRGYGYDGYYGDGFSRYDRGFDRYDTYYRGGYDRFRPQNSVQFGDFRFSWR